jgi:hypothetical protein
MQGQSTGEIHNEEVLPQPVFRGNEHPRRPAGEASRDPDDGRVLQRWADPRPEIRERAPRRSSRTTWAHIERRRADGPAERRDEDGKEEEVEAGGNGIGRQGEPAERELGVLEAAARDEGPADRDERVGRDGRNWRARFEQYEGSIG